MNDATPITLFVGGAEARILKETDPIELSCGVNGCSSNCCTKSAPIVLNPYEISLICRASGMSYEDLLDIVDTDRVNGFPLVMLPRDPACHFWTGKGCRVYEARPLACRLYPLGRVYEFGMSHIVQPALNVCSGLSSAPQRTVRQYLEDQQAMTQIAMADAWIDFVSQVEAMQLPDKPVTSVAFHMLVYSPDTPPVASGENADSITAPEERFQLRLHTALDQLPKFLNRA